MAKIKTVTVKLTDRERYAVIQFVEGWMADSKRAKSKHVSYLNDLSTRFRRAELEYAIEELEEAFAMAKQEYNQLASEGKLTEEDFRNRPTKKSVLNEKYRLDDKEEEEFVIPKTLRDHIKMCIGKISGVSPDEYEVNVRLMEKFGVAFPEYDQEGDGEEEVEEKEDDKCDT